MAGTLGPVGPAVIVLDFDPSLHVGGAAIQLQTLGLALAMLVAILLLARLAVVERRRAAAVAGTSIASTDAAEMRLDDLLFMLLGAVPGAVIGGRVGSVLAHFDYYATHASAIIDPGFGGLSLGLGVIGGLLTATYVGRLLGVPLGPWAHAAALPLLLVLAAGKVALALGGTGQGLPSDDAWATAYLGSGPWGSLGPEVPSHPSQLYEALSTTVALVLVGGATVLGAFRRRDGAALFGGLALWAIGRAVVAATWRDDAVLGPLRAEQIMALVIALGAVGGLLALRRQRRVAGRAALTRRHLDEPGPEWPDPETRPRF